MTQITKNLKTHIAYIRDGEEINLTTEQYQTLRLAKEDKKSRDMVTIKDPDTHKILFDGEYGDIKKFKERQTGNYGEYRYRCDFGHVHSIYEECGHSRLYGCIPCVFIDKLNAIGYKIEEKTEITREMQNDYLTNNK